MDGRGFLEVTFTPFKFELAARHESTPPPPRPYINTGCSCDSTLGVNYPNVDVAFERDGLKNAWSFGLFIPLPFLPAARAKQVNKSLFSSSSFSAIIKKEQKRVIKHEIKGVDN